MHLAPILKALFLVAMWGTCLYFIIVLSTDYKRHGSKASSKTDVVQVEVMDAPWLALIGLVADAGECYYGMWDCYFVKVLDTDYTKSLKTCSDSITITSDKESLMNKTVLSQLGINFTNPYDTVVLNLTLLKNDPLGIPTPVSFADCGVDIATMDDPMLIPIGDQTVVDAMDNGTPVNAKQMGIPTFIGPGQKAQLTFSLNQEQYLNGTIRNTTEFGITQYPKHKLEYIEVHINPGTFAMQRVVHTKGQSLVNLMGSIFGWIGVLTGACMYSIFSYLVDFVEDHKKVTKQHLEALGQNSKTKPNLSEPTAAVHPLVDI
eukprot:TRINITY_DN3315_c0_g1_i3.p1 TRINITY_DN3315_c0_g1~~TRINITY_DN3315_c0_g1_i3.p1  ORF type:complete len:318 (+),score=56.04 TRINITY_DN3315_c0_g1_i3:44-997(+)